MDIKEKFINLQQEIDKLPKLPRKVKVNPEWFSKNLKPKLINERLNTFGLEVEFDDSVDTYKFVYEKSITNLTAEDGMIKINVNDPTQVKWFEMFKED